MHAGHDFDRFFRELFGFRVLDALTRIDLFLSVRLEVFRGGLTEYCHVLVQNYLKLGVLLN